MTGPAGALSIVSLSNSTLSLDFNLAVGLLAKADMDSVSGLLRVFLIFAWLLRFNAVTTPSDLSEIFAGE
jgi:hypothetical protein